MLYTAALTLKWQSLVAATEIIWPVKPKIFSILSFTKKVYDPSLMVYFQDFF